jgi:hypothetical protein
MNEHHDHWMEGSLEERVLMMILIAMAVLSPFVTWFHW